MPNNAVHELARVRWGVLTVAAMRAHGMTDDEIRYAISTGDILPVQPGSYLHAAAPSTFEARALAAIWSAGADAAGSHRTAARLLDLRRCRGYDGVEVAVQGSRLPVLRRARVRRSTMLEAIDVHPVTLDPDRSPIPVTRIERTLVDLGAVVPVDVLRSALEDALLRGLTTIERLWRYLTRYGARGRPGVAKFRQVLRDRDPSWAPTESGLEDRLVDTLEKHDVEVPTPQIWVRAPSGRRFRLDRGYEDILLAIEVNSVYFHTSPEAQRRDAEKRNVLLQLGWRVYVVTEFDLEERPAWLASDIERTVAELRAGLGRGVGRLWTPASANLVA